MVFEQLPESVLAVLLGVSCAVKHTAVTRLVFTDWYQRQMRLPYWYWAMSLSSLMGAVLTYLIFDRFVGWPVAAWLAMADYAMYVASGFYARRIKLFDMKGRRFRRTVFALRSAFVVAYLVYIWLTLRLR